VNIKQDIIQIMRQINAIQFVVTLMLLTVKKNVMMGIVPMGMDVIRIAN
jgi:hypothetical protein